MCSVLSHELCSVFCLALALSPLFCSSPVLQTGTLLTLSAHSEVRETSHCVVISSVSDGIVSLICSPTRLNISLQLVFLSWNQFGHSLDPEPMGCSVFRSAGCFSLQKMHFTFVKFINWKVHAELCEEKLHFLNG